MHSMTFKMSYSFLFYFFIYHRILNTPCLQEELKGKLNFAQQKPLLNGSNS